MTSRTSPSRPPSPPRQPRASSLASLIVGGLAWIVGGLALPAQADAQVDEAHVVEAPVVEAEAFAWTAPPECIQSAALAREVAVALGGGWDPRLELEGSLMPEGSGWRALVRVRERGRERAGAWRTRRLVGREASCTSMTDAVIVVAALLFDEEAHALAPETEAIPTAQVPARGVAASGATASGAAASGASATPSDATDAPSSPSSATEPDAREGEGSAGDDVVRDAGWTSVTRLALRASLDALPGLAGAGALEVELAPPSLGSSGVRVAVLASVGGAPGVEALDASGRGGHFASAWAGLGACVAVPLLGAARELGSLELGGCALGRGEWLLADGRGVSDPAHAEGLAASVAAEAMARVALGGSLALRVGLGAAVPLVRARASLELVDGQRVVHESAAVVLEGSVGLELAVP